MPIDADQGGRSWLRVHEPDKQGFYSMEFYGESYCAGDVTLKSNGFFGHFDKLEDLQTLRSLILKGYSQ